MKGKFFSRQYLLSDYAIIIYFALFKLLLHFSTSINYGLHRDEFLYIDMGKHLAWGYLEAPPTIAIIAKISGIIFGHSIFGYKFFPALGGAGLVIITGLMVRQLGGGRFAQIVAALCIIFSPAFLRINTFLMPVFMVQFYWTLGAFLIILLLKKGNPKIWLAIGVVIGLGFLNKYSMLFFGFGLLGGLLLTPNRKMLLTRWPWLAAGIAFIIFLPNLMWQISNDWPFVEHMRILSKSQLVHVEPFNFIMDQFIFNGIISTPVWLIGFYFFLVAKSGKKFRLIGWFYLSIFILLLILSGKSYYLMPAYPVLFAGGAFAIEKFINTRQINWLKPVVIVLLINLVTIPYGLPILPIKTAQKYFGFLAESMGLDGPLRWETGEIHSLPQDYADMQGWENQVETVAKVYQNLSKDEQAKCVIMGANYGEIGALNYYRGKYKLPRAIGVNGSNYIWGPGSLPGEILLTVGLSKESMNGWFDEIEVVATITHKFARENNIPVLVCRNPEITLQEIWPRLKKYRY